MKIAKTVPSKGDYYPTVRAWMQRLGMTAHDVRANEVMVDEKTARLYIAAVMGKRFPVKVRKLNATVGRGGSRYITLDRQQFKAKSMSLGTVLHEIAHAVQLTRYKEAKEIRRETRLKKRIVEREQHPRVKRSDTGHGEAFCRTYARLLRDTMN